MELKSRNLSDFIPLNVLLIVPYGIEINLALYNRTVWGVLLIVPYGIEITVSTTARNPANLLIVPYGIEIRLSVLSELRSGRF